MSIWPRQAEVRSIFGEPGSPQCTAGMCELPFPMVIAWDKSQIIRRFRCHAKVEASFERVFQNAFKHYGQEQLVKLGLNVFGGCYNYRPMRGGKNWSMHAWGIAVDLDPTRNQLKWGKDRAVFARPEYKKFWEIVEAEGLLSLGRARDYDWMHFQAARL